MVPYVTRRQHYETYGPRDNREQHPIDTEVDGEESGDTATDDHLRRLDVPAIPSRSRRWPPIILLAEQCTVAGHRHGRPSEVMSRLRRHRTSRRRCRDRWTAEKRLGRTTLAHLVARRL